MLEGGLSKDENGAPTPLLDKDGRQQRTAAVGVVGSC
jgi:hypothetical protein